MSIMEWRGGIPAVFAGTVDTSGTNTSPLRLGAHLIAVNEGGRKGPITSKWLVIQNHDVTNDIRMYFTQTHFDNDEHFVRVRAGANQLSVWYGPVEAEEVWLRSSAGTAEFDLTAFSRRG